ncbi:hypothetical protein [Phytomonospora endophytica]|uniref:Uncharacterized protein n=1 Tax=Phytomonospora endophytica TaxID=714109 RepID=A0A841G1R8_9ACTN|nr:hypothetical protein [Phytomonospora endophytica]MBB6039868.1 hypothetical protein [Phytomonospora endophytica]
MGVAGGVVLLAAGVAQAADGTTVGKAGAPTAGVAGLGQMLNPTDLVGGATGALASDSPLGLPSPTGALGSLPGGGLLGADKGHGKGVKEAGPADAFGKMAGGLTHGVQKGVSKGLPVNGGLPSVGNMPLGMIPSADGLNSLDSQSVVADLMSVQSVLDQQPTEGLPLPVGGLDTTAGNVLSGATGAIPSQDLTGGLPTAGITNGLPLVGGLTGGQPAAAPQAPKPAKPAKATEKKVKPADQPMPLPQPQADPISGLVGGLPVAGGLAGGPLSTVTGTTGGLPVVGGLTKGGLPGLPGAAPVGVPTEGKVGMPVATDLLGGLPLVGDLTGGMPGKALTGDIAGR